MTERDESRAEADLLRLDIEHLRRDLKAAEELDAAHEVMLSDKNDDLVKAQAEVERLLRIMDACAEELKGTMEYGGVLGALRRREMPD